MEEETTLTPLNQQDLYYLRQSALSLAVDVSKGKPDTDPLELARNFYEFLKTN